MLRFLPPAGTRLKWSDYYSWAVNVSRHPSKQLLGQWLQDYDGGTPFLVSSGRTALLMALNAMHRCRPDRTEVIVPSYTCYSIPACIVRAGLKLRIADIDPATLSIEPNSLAQMDMSNVLAVMATNLYGFPDDIVRLSETTKNAGVYLIDDAAQSLGATIGQRSSGTFGSVGIYSFDKGKAITSFQGGVVTSRDEELTSVLAALSNELPPPGYSNTMIHAAVLAAYGLLLNPYLYNVPARLPFLGLGKTEYREDFPISGYPEILAAFTLALTSRFEGIVSARRAIGNSLRESLLAHSELTAVRPVSDSVPSYLRFPLLVKEEPLRQRIHDSLLQHGLGVSTSYPQPISALPELQRHIVNPGPCENGSLVARSILTLPTHGFVRQEDVQDIAKIICGF